MMCQGIYSRTDDHMRPTTQPDLPNMKAQKDKCGWQNAHKSSKSHYYGCVLIFLKAHYFLFLHIYVSFPPYALDL